MKKLASLCVAVVCIMVLLPACGNSNLVQSIKAASAASASKPSESSKAESTPSLADKTDSAVSSASTPVKSGKAITSSIDNALTKGQWGICSKYNAEVKKYQNIDITITNFTRGDAARTIVKKYVEQPNSIYKWKELDKGQEWVVVNYSILFDQFKLGELGANPDVTTSVCSKSSKSAVVYNNASYIISTTGLGNRDYVKSKGGDSSFAFALPKGCTDYIITFGEYNETNAYFKGE